jgi:hypothetical protein
MSTRYQYDYSTKNVLIRRLDDKSFTEILHKGDSQWTILAPREDYKDEDYCRAVFLGQGCWEDLKVVSEDKAHQIIKDWGYEKMPPEATALS